MRVRTAELVAALERELPSAVALRRELHRHPESSGEEGATRDRVLAALPSTATVVPVAGTGALVRCGGAGPAVALRAELDALHVAESTGVSWSSARAGLMHACGHDVHLAALTAVVRAVASVGGAPLVAVLQPREETYPSGAKDIVDSGLLLTQECAMIFSAHVQPLLPAGSVACTPGPVNASSDEFVITVTGKGGHAAYPHLTQDPVLAMSQIVVALQSIVSRNVDPMSPVVVGVSSIRSGSDANVIPGIAVARGTIRCLSAADRHTAAERLTTIAQSVAAAFECTAAVRITSGEPVLDNDPLLAARTGRMLGSWDVRVVDTLRTVGADDFSYFADSLPSLMMFVGVDTPDGSGGQLHLHSSGFLPPDDAVGDVARALLAGYIEGSVLLAESAALAG